MRSILELTSHSKLFQLRRLRTWLSTALVGLLRDSIPINLRIVKLARILLTPPPLGAAIDVLATVLVGRYAISIDPRNIHFDKDKRCAKHHAQPQLTIRTPSHDGAG